MLATDLSAQERVARTGAARRFRSARRARWRRTGAASGRDDAAVVRAALDLFHARFTYTLASAAARRAIRSTISCSTRSAVFANTTRRAFVCLMRAAGIPARVVTGYQGGWWNAGEPLSAGAPVRRARLGRNLDRRARLAARRSDRRGQPAAHRARRRGGQRRRELGAGELAARAAQPVRCRQPAVDAGHHPLRRAAPETPADARSASPTRTRATCCSRCRPCSAWRCWSRRSGRCAIRLRAAHGDALDRAWSRCSAGVWRAPASSAVATRGRSTCCRRAHALAGARRRTRTAGRRTMSRCATARRDPRLNGSPLYARGAEFPPAVGASNSRRRDATLSTARSRHGEYPVATSAAIVRCSSMIEASR